LNNHYILLLIDLHECIQVKNSSWVTGFKHLMTLRKCEKW